MIPNLRRPLWNDDEALKKAVLEFLPLADVLKLSDEELFFLTGCHDIEEARPLLFQGRVQLIVYTEGAKGAFACTREALCQSPGISVKSSRYHRSRRRLYRLFPVSAFSAGGLTQKPFPPCLPGSWKPCWTFPTVTVPAVCKRKEPSPPIPLPEICSVRKTGRKERRRRSFPFLLFSYRTASTSVLVYSVLRLHNHLIRRPSSTIFPFIHNQYPITEILYQSQIMADKQAGHFLLFPQLRQTVPQSVFVRWTSNALVASSQIRISGCIARALAMAAL